MEIVTMTYGELPAIQYVTNSVGEIIAACVTGFVGDMNPAENRAIPENPRF